MAATKKYLLGVLLTMLLAGAAVYISSLIPNNFIGASVFALLIGMLINPVISKYECFNSGIAFVSKRVLRLGIILMGITLSFSQIVEVGSFSIIVMSFTLLTAFGVGYLLGKVFKLNWKLSSLISSGVGICGGSAIAAVAPVIDAEDSDIAYAISSIFIFDIIMVVLFPIAGKFLGMTDLGYGLWTGTAVNDTSAVVAAGYAFSDVAGSFSVIVKLTRTLSIIPVVLIFSFINERLNLKKSLKEGHPDTVTHKKVSIKKIFPWFILMFLGMVAIKSTGMIPEGIVSGIAKASKFLMIMALGAIGLKTSFKNVAKSGFKPMLHGFILSIIVVVVSLLVQMMLGQL